MRIVLECRALAGDRLRLLSRIVRRECIQVLVSHRKLLLHLRGLSAELLFGANDTVVVEGRVADPAAAADEVDVWAYGWPLQAAARNHRLGQAGCCEAEHGEETDAPDCAKHDEPPLRMSPAIVAGKTSTADGPL